MKKSSSQKIGLGVFVILGTILLVTTLYFIGNRQNFFGNNMTINAYFNNVNGLKLGNNVRYSGIITGTVSKIEMKEEARILVEMVIEEELGKKIKTNAVATIGTNGLVGSTIVNIIPQEGNFPFLKSGDTIETYSKIGADDMLNTLSATNENAAILMSDLLAITTQIRQGRGTIGMLINDSLVAQDLKQSVSQLKNTATGASNTIAKLNAIVSTLDLEESVAGVLLNDSIAASKMSNVVANLEKSSISIDSITTNLNTYLNQITAGEGALSYIVNDENFTKDIDSTMANIKEATYRFNENMEAMKHNFLFRGYFRKLEKEQKKKDKLLKDK
jgi:phospholipid/cholesterol/gamma-HCH transport system substrate-binding protein